MRARAALLTLKINVCTHDFSHSPLKNLLDHAAGSIYNFQQCGCSSGVELLLPKQGVARSNRVTRFV
jgi:hypothetical protein